MEAGIVDFWCPKLSLQITTPILPGTSQYWLKSTVLPHFLQLLLVLLLPTVTSNNITIQMSSECGLTPLR